MTAPNTNSAASDNSIFQGTEDGPDTPANGRAPIQIIEDAYETAGTTTCSDLTIETQWSTIEFDQFLDRLEAIGYAGLINDLDRQMIVLMSRGHLLARGRR